MCFITDARFSPTLLDEICEIPFREKLVMMGRKTVGYIRGTKRIASPSPLSVLTCRRAVSYTNWLTASPPIRLRAPFIARPLSLQSRVVSTASNYADWKTPNCRPINFHSHFERPRRRDPRFRNTITHFWKVTRKQLRKLCECAVLFLCRNFGQAFHPGKPILSYLRRISLAHGSVICPDRHGHARERDFDRGGRLN